MIPVWICVIFVLSYFTITIFLCRGVKLGTKELCLCGITVALTLVLESVRVPLPTGATIPMVSMVPLMLLAILCNYRLAFLGGWICGVVCIVLIPAWAPVHWGQIFVEHMVCFSCIGFVSVFGTDKRWQIFSGIVLTSIIKLLAHSLSGVIFFSQNAWDGWGAWGYSIVYNVSQNLPLCILCGAIILALPLSTMKYAVEREH